MPNERLRILRVYVYESELEKIRDAAGLNIQSMSDFAFLAISEAAEECGAGPILTANARQRDRRRRYGNDQPVALERRKAQRRRPKDDASGCGLHNQSRQGTK